MNTLLLKNIPEIKKYIKSNGQINMRPLKKDIEIINKIHEKCSFIKEFNYSEALYCLRNNIKEIPLCENKECKKELSFKNCNLGYGKFCCRKCGSSAKIQLEKRKETNHKKYGGNSPFSSKEVQEKIKQTNLEKYGCVNPMSNIQNREKARMTMLKKYGFKNPFFDKDIQEKIKNNRSIKQEEERLNKMRYTWSSKSKEELQELSDKHKKRCSLITQKEKDKISKKRSSTNLEKYNRLWFNQKQFKNYELFYDIKFIEESFFLYYKHRKYFNYVEFTSFYNVSVVKAYRHIKDLNIIYDRQSSVGELVIESIIDSMNIKYQREYRFEKCKYKNTLPFDFYIKDFNICIEYDGKQHFEVIDHFGGKEQFKQQVIKDEIRNNFCKENGIGLIRFRYDQSFEEVEMILKETLWIR